MDPGIVGRGRGQVRVPSGRDVEGKQGRQGVGRSTQIVELLDKIAHVYNQRHQPGRTPVNKKQ